MTQKCIAGTCGCCEKDAPKDAPKPAETPRSTETLAPAMAVADLIAALQDEVRTLTKERDTLERKLASSNEAWATLRDVLDVPPNESVMGAIDRLVKRTSE